MASLLSHVKDNPFLHEIITCLKNHNISLKFVGGLVRDHFLCVSSGNTDIDCAVNKPIEDVYKVLKGIDVHMNTMAMHYGTLTVYDKHHSLSIEITALRQDIEAFGRQAHTAYTASWTTDAKRRDFTINAIYYDAENGFFDPLNGIEDLKNQRVIFIGDAQKRIREDYLRILRFFRFLSYFKDPIFDEETLNIIKHNADGLGFLSKERITHELFKIIKSLYPKNGLKKMTECHIWESLGVKSNIESFFFDFPEHFNLQDVLIFSFLDDGFLKNSISLSKKKLKSILLFKNLKNIFEAYYYLGEVGALNFAWYKHCVCNADFFSLSSDIRVLTIDYPSPAFPLNGHDLKNIGIEDKMMGSVLKHVKQWWIEGQFKPDKDACLNKSLIFINK